MKANKFREETEKGSDFDFISNNTISTIKPTKEGYVLTLYREKKTIFSKAYKTYNGANIAQTKLLKKFNLI